LGGTELADNDKSSWVAKNSKGGVQALIWDYHLLSPDSSYNQQFYSREIEPKPAGNVKLQIGHLANGTYKLRMFRIGYRHNDPYTAYLKMGAPSYLSIKQVQELKDISSGNADEVKEVHIKNGQWSDSFPIMQNEIYLITLEHV
jgi:xylan 1,4-beta-xylosidase